MPLFPGFSKHVVLLSFISLGIYPFLGFPRDVTVLYENNVAAYCCLLVNRTPNTSVHHYHRQPTTIRFLQFGASNARCPQRRPPHCSFVYISELHHWIMGQIRLQVIQEEKRKTLFRQIQLLKISQSSRLWSLCVAYIMLAVINGQFH